MRGRHITYRYRKHIVASSLFGSLTALGHVESSRRDDIESFGLILLWLSQGWRPWPSAQVATDGLEVFGIYNGFGTETQKDVYKQQATLLSNVKDLCGSNERCVQTIAYARTLRFDEKPDTVQLASIWKLPRSSADAMLPRKIIFVVQGIVALLLFMGARNNVGMSFASVVWLLSFIFW
jgi:hypothetical protein